MNHKIYKPNKTYNLRNGIILFLIIFIFITLPKLVSNIPVGKDQVVAVVGFWLLALIIFIVSFNFRLEIGPSFVKTYLFGYIISNINATDVKLIYYGNLFRGGLGYGKGLTYEVIVNGKKKHYSLGEKFWGKEAIEHAKSVLENK